MKKTFSSLAYILSSCNINLRGISWENISTLGDANIQYLIEAISSAYEYFLTHLEDTSVSLLMATDKKLYSKQILPIIQTLQDRNKLIIKRLKSLKTGEIKPLLPYLRKHSTYLQKEISMFPYGNAHVVQEWKPMFAPRAGNYPGNEKYHLHSFAALIDTRDEKAVGEFSYCGYYWQVQITSCTVMSHEELLFFKELFEKDADVPFAKLWFKNSGDRNVKSFEAFRSIVMMPIKRPKDFRFKKSVREIVKFFKDAKNFPEEEARGMERLGEAVENELKRPR